MADDELDQLYGVDPDEFTALRTRLAAAAKRGGDGDTAKQIAAARKPTTAAWIVNGLIRADTEAKQRLSDLGARLRAAHTAMDGERIRQLSAEQRTLVDELTRTAFTATELASPSAALRDDVIGTLQAAIADPDVAARLGRLTKAERWSGFGEFGDTAMVFTAGRRAKKPPEPPRAARKSARSEPNDDTAKAAHEQRETARAAVAAAVRAKAEADDALSERQSERATARLRHGQARDALADAERRLAEAEHAYEKAQQASREAAELAMEAKARLTSISRS